MLCPKCNQKMVQLLTSWVCDICSPAISPVVLMSPPALIPPVKDFYHPFDGLVEHEAGNFDNPKHPSEDPDDYPSYMDTMISMIPVLKPSQRDAYLKLSAKLVSWIENDSATCANYQRALESVLVLDNVHNLWQGKAQRIKAKMLYNGLIDLATRELSSTYFPKGLKAMSARSFSDYFCLWGDRRE